ncbi:DNA recombination protein RmuC [Parachryseolinea silvisoli]|jgi:DNA recombination protein RmuC|uniref:DNA recombination protein RmuC n=1 Tax=Parachryseolinea silvisoli TaxID=2873601 RepID=UPI002265ABA9|nr:DNA recombination protein RmuC [Parachryseolinea silvisoli]MCD9016839.1 DNA recombination protein RmuC [Parachryseolinea silvisoli]
MEIVLLIIGLAIGALAAWFIAKYKFTAETQSFSGPLLAEQERSKVLQSQSQVLKLELDAERARLLEMNHKLAAAQADYRNLQERLQDQRKEMEALNEKFALQFKNLANDIFEEKSKKFTEQNRTNLFDILKPLGEKITDFEKRVEDTHKDTITRNAALREQLENLQRLNVQMTREAENLTRALRGDAKTQGAWGEFILESILEKSGLEKDREYFIQESFTTAEGRLRPDVIIRLPEKRHVIIDSKVSLTAYTNFVNAATEEEKVAALKSHLISIRQHMKLLGDKNYQKNISDSSLDFVIMFIPVEPAYILAIQSEQMLYEEALERRIVFVSPTLLIPSLQLIKNNWKQEYQTRNVIEIASKAGDLYDKFVGFSDDMISLGRHLETSKKFYEESMKKLSVGSGNLVGRVENLKKLGVKAGKSIDANLLKRSEDQPDMFER